MVVVCYQIVIGVGSGDPTIVLSAILSAVGIDGDLKTFKATSRSYFVLDLGYSDIFYYS